MFPEPPQGVSYTLECAERDATVEGTEHVFTNTGTIRLRIIVSLAMGTPGYTVAAGESRVIYGPAGSRYELWYEDPASPAGGYTGFGEGHLSDCDEEPTEPAPSFTLGCGYAGYPFNTVTNTGNVSLNVTWEHVSGQPDVTLPVAPGDVMGIADMTEDRSYVISWDDGGTTVVLAEGEWEVCEDTTPTLPASEIPPDSECRGEDWYIVHPGPDADGNTHHYRTNLGVILVPAGENDHRPAIRLRRVPRSGR